MASRRDLRPAGRWLFYAAAGLAAAGGVLAALAQTGGDGSDAAVGADGPAPTTAGGGTTGSAPVTAGPRVQVKFEDGSGVRLRDGRFVSVTGRDMAPVARVLASFPGTVIERLFSRSEEELAADKAKAEAASGRTQPDLNLYYRLTLPAGADRALAIAALVRLDVVERAYADPDPAPPPAALPVP